MWITRLRLKSSLAISTSTIATSRIRALTAADPIKPTSLICGSARQDNLGRCSTYRYGKIFSDNRDPLSPGQQEGYRESLNDPVRIARWRDTGAFGNAGRGVVAVCYERAER
jgi:hypothetical protein